MVNLVALLVSAKGSLPVYAEIPDPPPDPVMQVREDAVFAPTSHMPDHLYEVDVELQTWGSTKLLAWSLVHDFADILRGQPSNQHGVVTRSQMVSNLYLPDTEVHNDFGRPMPRYITLYRMFCHPTSETVE